MNGGRTHDFQESLNREIVDGILARCVEIYKIYRTKAARPTIPARPAPERTALLAAPVGMAGGAVGTPAPVPAGPVGAALPPAGGAVGVLMVLLVKAGGTTLLPPAGTEPVGAAAPLWDIC
jgi:hypothetical protein